MVPAPRPRFDVRCIRTSGTQAPCVSTRGKRRCVLARVAITSVCYCGGILAAVLLLGFALRVALLCPCVAVMAAMLRVPARACVRTLARVCCMCNLAPAPSVTRIKLWSSRSRHDMTPAERRLQKNGQHVGAIGACAMTWSGMPLSRGSGHFCTCGERRAASTVVRMMLADAGVTNDIIMCVLGAYLECHDSYLACRFMWRTGAGTLRLRCVMGGRYRHGDAAKR
jgi:hypothetical protein